MPARLGLQVNNLHSKTSTAALHPEHQAFIEVFLRAGWRVELFDWRDCELSGLVCNQSVNASTWETRLEVPLEEIADVVVIRSMGSVERDRDRLVSYWKALDACFPTRVVNQEQWMVRGSDKRYLIDLQSAGLPVIPTVLASKPDSVADLHAASPWPLSETVVKPVHGECGNSVARGGEVSDDWLQDKRELVQDWLLQPFVPEISQGERSLIFVGGTYSYSVLKSPQEDDFRNNRRWIESISLYSPTDEERRLATLLVESSPEPPHICRVDLVRSENGPLILEFETVNPSLYIGQVDGGPRMQQALSELELLARTLSAA